GRGSRSCASGSGRPAPRSASRRSPRSSRGDDAPGGARAPARGDVALPGAGLGARDDGARQRATGDLRPVAQSHPALAVSPPRRRDGPPHQSPPRRGYLAELSERWGYRVVRGSSQRGGDVGLLGLVRHLRQGGEVALTPDGPRGPAERMKPGALAAAQHANALVIAAGARTSSAWWIRSWDQFCLPRPFAAVD